MSLAGNKARLGALTKDITLRWQETRDHWRDARSQEFHEHYMRELFAQVDKTITVIEKLDVVLAKVKKDCE